MLICPAFKEMKKQYRMLRWIEEDQYAKLRM